MFGDGTAPYDAEQLMSAAVEAGINCFDSAEMYPVPQRADTQAGGTLHLWIHSSEA